MHQLIQFRQLTSELNKSELKQLFSTLIENESFNEEFIITSMFNQMHKNLYNSKQSPIQTINNTITNIINEREIPIDDSSKDTSITFESLSSTIVNEIGSYLTINEMCNFEKTNRRNFISMRYPYPALYSIGFDNLLWLEAYSENKLFDFAQFKGVKKLGFNASQYYELKDKFESHGIIFTKVENLCLYAIYDNELSCILQNNNCNYTSLKHLSLTEIHITSIEQVNAFKQLLTTNTDLQSLQIKYGSIDSIDIQIKDALFIDPSIIAQQLPNLNALSVCGELCLYEQIVHELNHQIESLDIDDTNILNLPKGFPNLKELYIHVGRNLNVIEDVINKIMKKSKKIEQLNIEVIISCNSQTGQFSDIAQKIGQISDLKLLQLTLHCIQKKVNEPKIFPILCGLNKFLMNHKRDMFKLIINSNSEAYYDEQILNLTTIMKAWITQFSFVFVCSEGFALKENTINTLKQIANVECYNIGENQEKYDNNNAMKYIISSNGDICIPCIYACTSHAEYEATCGVEW